MATDPGMLKSWYQDFTKNQGTKPEDQTVQPAAQSAAQPTPAQGPSGMLA